MELVSSWQLWSQPLLCLLVFVLTWRARELLFKGGKTPLLLFLLCLLAPAAAAILLPQSSYHFAGHEGSYGSALLGQAPAMDDLHSYGTMPLPMGLSWFLGQLAPGVQLQQLWLIGNRLSLALALWLLGMLVLGLARHGQAGEDALASRRAAFLVVLLGMTSVPLAAWSATGYFVTPALALGLCALVLAVRGELSLALLWAVLALGSRMELGLVLLAVLAIAPLKSWTHDVQKRGWLPIGVGVPALGLEVFLLATKKARLPVDSFTVDVSIFWENLLNIPLGGALFSPLTLLVAVAIIVLSGVHLSRDRSLAVFVLAFLGALIQPMLLIDVGARHFLPALMFGLPLLALALSRLLSRSWRSQASAIALSGLLAAITVAPGVWEYVDLGHRYVAGQDGYLTRWVAIADQGVRGSIDELLEPSGCYVVMPGGESTWKGASEGGDVREVHNSVLALREGQCVRWAFAGEVEFSGSASAERVDRAIHTLGLVPLGWLDPPPAGKRPWILFGVGKGDSEL